MDACPQLQAGKDGEVGRETTHTRSTDPQRGHYTVMSLFSGCGGLDLGFEEAGFRIVAANDSWAPAIRTYRVNFHDPIMVPGDITDEEVRATLSDACGGHCDVLIGGPDCKPYSSSGRGDPSDPRARLFEFYLDMVDRVSPVVTVLENVPRIVSKRNPQGFLIAAEIIAGFRRLGYCVDYRVLNSADFGVPQLRQRIILIAAKQGVRIRFPHPTHGDGDSLFEDRLPWVTVKDAIGDLVDAPADAGSWHVFTKHGAGLVSRMMRTPYGGHCGGRFGDGYHRDRPDRPSSIIKTVAWPIHYSGGRVLTPREAARIQSFPDTHKLIGSKTQVEAMIGNAVPPLLALAIARSVREMLDEAKQRTTSVSLRLCHP